MLQKKIYPIIFLYGSMLSVGNSSVVDNGLVTGVYEASCENKDDENFYNYKLSLDGSSGRGVSGIVEFYPKENKLGGSCGAFNVSGTLSFKIFGDNDLILRSESWIYYYSGSTVHEDGDSAKGAVKFEGSFKPDNFVLLINHPDRNGFDGCTGFKVKRISDRYPEKVNLNNKNNCESGMITNSESEMAAKNDKGLLGVLSAENIVGLKLNMNFSEIEPFLKRFKQKGYSVSKKTNKTNYLDKQESYLESMSFSKKDKDRISVEFFRPPHNNTISSISRIREYIKDMANAPFPEEVINHLVKKYGSPRKWIKPKISDLVREGNNPGKDDFQESGILWSDFKCRIGVMTTFDLSMLVGRRNKSQFSNAQWAFYDTNNSYPILLYSKKKECGMLFSFAYLTTNYDNDKRVTSFVMHLSDTTGIIKNDRKIEELHKLLQDKKERIRVEEKIRKIKGSTFDDDI